jgi:hypothetical protein
MLTHTDFADSVCKIFEACRARKNARICVRSRDPNPRPKQIFDELPDKGLSVFRPLRLCCSDSTIRRPISQ